MPGPVHSPASAGSNQLLYDGPGPVRNARDVLDGLGIFVSAPSRTVVERTPARGSPTDRASSPSGAEGRRVLDAVPGGRPRSTRSWRAAASRSPWRPGGLDSLEAAGLVRRDGRLVGAATLSRVDRQRPGRAEMPPIRPPAVDWGWHRARSERRSAVSERLIALARCQPPSTHRAGSLAIGDPACAVPVAETDG